MKVFKICATIFFRYCFPFGRPEGALKSTLTLFERVRLNKFQFVFMKDLVPRAILTCQNVPWTI